MILANYQTEFVDKIYDILISTENNNGITLCGSSGCGKSTIALSAAQRLKEGWSVFYIDGIDSGLSPYLTWHIGTTLHSKRKLNLSSEISFGLNFFPVPLSLEFGNTVHLEKHNYILTPNEEALIAGLKKQTDVNEKLLIIADDFELWDIPSKQFLHKILLPELNLLPNVRVAAILVSHNTVSVDGNLTWDTLSIDSISDEDVLFVLRQHEYSGRININDIRICAGDDLSLALMAAEYYEEGQRTITSFGELMDKRCANLVQEKRNACHVLEPLSIIDSYFTKFETAYFMSSGPNDNLEAEFQAEEYLALAEECKFITGEERYHFTNEKIRSYFRNRLSNKEKLYHRKFSNYLRQCYPEDYFSRGKHLKNSLTTKDSKIIIEAWQLLFLAYIRRSSGTGKAEDVYHIFPDINSLLELLPPNLEKSQKYVLKQLLDGYYSFSKYQYKAALFHLQSITPSQLTVTCLAEIQRLILLCHIHLAENPINIKKYAEELFDTISDDFCEDEQYCQAALVLLDVYIDRSIDAAKCRTIQKKLVYLLQHYFGHPVFEEFEACYNRKAALYFTAVIAYRQTSQSIQFYQSNHNCLGLYMALCNHSGNAIVSGNYLAAEESINECIGLNANHTEWYFPSFYKVKNNQILLQYLVDESSSYADHKKILTAAKMAASAFSNMVNQHEDEVSHVVFLNYLSLSILCNSNNWMENLISANQRLSDADVYYQYYLHDLNFAGALLQNDLIKARNELMTLKNLDVPLLQHYRQIFLKRFQIQEYLLAHPAHIDNDPMRYQEAFAKKCSHIQDPSCYFYGRGFLLSDLQFLSF